MKNRITVSYILARILLVFLLFVTFMPIIAMINMSVKPTVMVRTDFWGLPTEIYWENFKNAVEFILWPVFNSLRICATALFFILTMVSLSGYAFGKMRFRGKKFFYAMIIGVMMVPGTLLIIPNYEIVSFLGVMNTYWALILPYIWGQQVMGIILAQTFYAGLPMELFEAAKIDGASEFQRFSLIALPISKPILITVGITAFNSMYNDYIWPTIVLTTGDKYKTFCQVVFNNASGTGTTDLGLIAAAFIIGTIPLVILTSSMMKYYISGMMIGSVKG